MTWNEFKQHIDILLDKKGISRDSHIWYIDVSFPEVDEIGKEDYDNTNCPTVEIDHDSGIIIT